MSARELGLPWSLVPLKRRSLCDDCQIGEPGDTGSYSACRSAKVHNKFLVDVLSPLSRGGVGGITFGLPISAEQGSLVPLASLRPGFGDS